MLIEFLAAGGIFFWAIVGLVFLVLTTQVHNERVGWATFTLILFIAGLVLLTGAGKIIASWPLIYYVYAVGAYLGISAVWAAIKWRVFFLPKLFERYEEVRSAWLNRNGLKEMPADPAVIQKFKDNTGSQINRDRMVSHNKGRITTWMIFWPWSLLETFLGDFLVRVFDYMYKAVAGGFQRMSDRMASKYSELN